MLVTQQHLLRRYFHPVAFAADLADGPLGRRLLGVDVVLWAGSEGPRAAADRCPHRDGRLSDGWYDGARLVCAYHGWEYDGDGRCVRIPQQNADQRPSPRAVLATMPCVEALGLIWVCLESDPLGGIATLPECTAADWRVIREFDTPWACPAPMLIDNNFDLAHFAFVHRATFGAAAGERVALDPVEQTTYGLVSRASAAVAARPGERVPTRRQMANELHAPFTAVLRITYPDGLEHVIVKAVTPVDDTTCRLLQFAVRNDSEADRPAADIVAFDGRVAAEDRGILERITRPYALDLDANVHVQSDRGSIGLRRLWADLCAGTWQPGKRPDNAANPRVA